jgi:hypothetical protein
MKAQSLSICVPNKGCDKNCRYCISKMTGDVPSSSELMRRNYPKVHKLAETSNVVFWSASTPP